MNNVSSCQKSPQNQHKDIYQWMEWSVTSGNGIEGAVVCPSQCSRLRPLSHFHGYISFRHPVYQFSTPYASYWVYVPVVRHPLFVLQSLLLVAEVPAFRFFGPLRFIPLPLGCISEEECFWHWFMDQSTVVWTTWQIYTGPEIITCYGLREIE